MFKQICAVKHYTKKTIGYSGDGLILRVQTQVLVSIFLFIDI